MVSLLINSVTNWGYSAPEVHYACHSSAYFNLNLNTLTFGMAFAIMIVGFFVDI